MAFIKAKIDKQSVKESTGGGGYISQSGIYDVSIVRASVSEAKSGAVSVDYTLSNSTGNESTFYGNYVTTKEGKDVDKNGRQLPGGALLNKIMIIHGIEELDDPVEQELKLGKDKKEVTLNVLEDLDDLELKVQVQEEYSLYKDEIQRKLIIKSVFRSTDGASAEEIVADAEGDEVEFGRQLGIIQEKYADKITYRDGLTEEDVAAWKKAKEKGGDTSTKSSTKATVKNKSAGSLFKK